MGNTETHPEDRLPPNSGKFIWKKKTVEPLCDLREEKELEALRRLPIVRPVNPDVLNANFVTRAHAIAPEAMDVRQIMLIIWDYNGHVKERAEAAAAAQERSLTLLSQGEEFLAQCVETLNNHKDTICALTDSFGVLRSVSSACRDTRERASYAEEAARRLDLELGFIESRIEAEHPHLLESMPEIPAPPPEQSLFEFRGPERLVMPLGTM